MAWEIRPESRPDRPVDANLSYRPWQGRPHQPISIGPEDRTEDSDSACFSVAGSQVKSPKLAALDWEKYIPKPISGGQHKIFLSGYGR